MAEGCADRGGGALTAARHTLRQGSALLRSAFVPRPLPASGDPCRSPQKAEHSPEATARGLPSPRMGGPDVAPSVRYQRHALPCQPGPQPRHAAGRGRSWSSSPLRFHHLPKRLPILRSQLHRVDDEEPTFELDGHHLERHAARIEPEKQNEVLILWLRRVQRERTCLNNMQGSRSTDPVPRC